MKGKKEEKTHPSSQEVIWKKWYQYGAFIIPSGMATQFIQLEERKKETKKKERRKEKVHYHLEGKEP